MASSAQAGGGGGGGGGKRVISLILSTSALQGGGTTGQQGPAAWIGLIAKKGERGGGSLLYSKDAEGNVAQLQPEKRGSYR